MADGDRADIQREDGPLLRPVSLGDLLAELRWPRLLKTPGMALRPERYLPSLILVAIFALIGWLVGLTLGVDHAAGLFDQEVQRVAAGFGSAELGLWQLVGHAWWTIEGIDAWALTGVILMTLVALPMWAWLGGLIGRSVALEVRDRRAPGLTAPARFATRRLISTLIALLGPTLVLLVPAIALGLIVRLLGLAAYIDVVGAVLFGVLLLVALLGMLGLLAFGVGGSMLAPAVACEASDGVDGVQRVFAYVLARPITLLLYLLVTGIVSWLALWVLNWATVQGAQLSMAVSGMTPGGGDERSVAEQIVGWWLAVIRLLGAALGVSLVHTGGTLVYLLMRDACDGQDWRDIASDPTDPAQDTEPATSLTE